MTPASFAGGVFFIFASSFYLLSSTLRLWEHEKETNKWVMWLAAVGATAWIIASACVADYLQTVAAVAYFVEAIARITNVRDSVVAGCTLLGAFLWVAASLRDNNDLQDIASISYAAAAVSRSLTLACCPEKKDLGPVVASCFSIFGSFMWLLMAVLLLAE